ncbi:MAG: efflux RND transporter periplasmic adaptor subunit [Rhodothermales bacterium]
MLTSRRLLFLCCLFAFGAVTLSGCGEAQSKEPDEPEVTPAIPVEAATVTRGDISAHYIGTASLEAEEEAGVVPKVSGIAEEVLVEEGDYVRKGQVLVKLDAERQTLELARQEVTLQKLKREFERNEELFNKKFVSVEAYELSRSSYDQQQAAYNLAKLDVEYASVRAPISGIISARMVKVGNMIQAQTPVYTITDFDPLLAIMNVPEKELTKLRVGQETRVQVDALLGEAFTGRIKRISPIVDATTGTFKVTIEVRDGTRRLKPGMFGRVQIVYDTHADALLVPRDAVITEDSESSVFTVTNDGVAMRQMVQVGYVDDRHAEILVGLEEAAQVITTGQSTLRDSTVVEVIR